MLERAHTPGAPAERRLDEHYVRGDAGSTRLGSNLDVDRMNPVGVVPADAQALAAASDAAGVVRDTESRFEKRAVRAATRRYASSPGTSR
jgi:hypothetical protein